MPSGANLDVGGLEIAMDDALFVRGSSASAICRAMATRLGERHRPARDDLRQVVALDQFHDERMQMPPDSSRPWMCAMFG